MVRITVIRKQRQKQAEVELAQSGDIHERYRAMMNQRITYPSMKHSPPVSPEEAKRLYHLLMD